MTPETAKIVGFLLLAIGAALLLGVGGLYALARSSARWSSVEGRITSSRLARERDTGTVNRGLSDRVFVTYEYEVGGRRLVGKRRNFGDSLFGWMRAGKLTERLHEAYPVGRTVTVYYDPSHPERCTLSRDIDEARFKQLLVVAVIIVVAGIGAVCGIVKVR